MPAQNGTGPQGNGPTTGRGMGRCRVGTGNNDTSVPAVGGRGSGCGRRNQACRRGNKGNGNNNGGGMSRGGFGMNTGGFRSR